jgi:hypothetical protein
MTPSNPNLTASDCLFNTILGFMLPFFLAGAGGNRAVAAELIRTLIEAYNASTLAELDLAGRIIGFSTAAMDNLRLSMAPDLSDTKVLRYRSNAVTLCRASDQSRKMLEAIQEKRPVTRDVPRPTVAAAPAAPKPALAVAATVAPVAPKPALAVAGSSVPAAPHDGMADFVKDLETMKRDARILMGAFSKNGASQTADPAAAIRAIARPGISAVLQASIR